MLLILYVSDSKANMGYINGKLQIENFTHNFSAEK
jgi:hypothetical protein